MTRSRLYGLTAAAFAVLFLLAVAAGYFAGSDGELESAESGIEDASVAREIPRALDSPRAEPGPPAADGGAAQQSGLVLTLTARRSCWIATVIDGGQRLERLLAQNETIILRAEDEVMLRAGDAGALSVLINNQLTKPLGAAGQVVTTRITRANVGDFLVGL
jgi:hypothetical protein